MLFSRQSEQVELTLLSDYSTITLRRANPEDVSSTLSWSDGQ